MGIADLIKANMVSVERRQQAPPSDLSGCMVVNKVAPISVAAVAGIVPGDLLLSVAGEDAAGVETVEMLDPKTPRDFVFYCPQSSEGLKLEAKCYPIGIELGQTPDTLLQLAEEGELDYDDLDSVWERGDWELLEKAARAMLDPGWIIRIILFFMRRSTSDSPASLLLGAALYEQGKQDEGMEMIRKYYEEYEDGWTTQFHAMGRYYLADEALRGGDREVALRFLYEAFELSPLNRVADKIVELTGERPTESKPWQGKTFPVNYQLDSLSGGEPVSLSSQLATLTEGQLLTVCLLATYRANGPYHEFVGHYQQWWTHFPQVVSELHVVTMTREASGSAKLWLGGEKAALQAGAPLRVLYDDGEVTANVGPDSSPFVLLLNREGLVVYEGVPDDAQFWDVLSQLASDGVSSPT